MQESTLDEAFVTWGPPGRSDAYSFTRCLMQIEEVLHGAAHRMDDYTCAGMLAIEQALEIRNTDGWATWSYYHGIGEW